MASLQRFHSFSELSAPWQDFAARTATTFDQSLPWFELFERYLLEPHQRMHILGVADAAGDPLALLPLRTDRVALASRLHTPALTALSNYYTALFAPLAEAGRDGELTAPLIAGMLETGRSVIDLNPLASDTALLANMTAGLQQRGFSIERYFRFGNWYLEVAGRSSKDYVAGLPGQLRSTLQRKGKKLRARPDVSIRIVTDPAEVPAAMEAYEAVYRSSWKNDEPHKDFIRAVVLEFARRDWLRLGLVQIGQTPAAAQIWFVYRGTASIFKLAYDEQFTDLSVGSALTLALMQRVIDEDRVAVVDYLCGDDNYKRDWMSARRERVGLRAVRSLSWPGAIHGVLQMVRRVAGRPAASR
jgi:CelD/BcsL family acetyltransferase involved in cellulose biosynthesis